MKRSLFPAALLFLGALLVAVALERPEPPDGRLFGAEVPLPAELPPLALPCGDLEVGGRVVTADGAPAADVLVLFLRQGEPGEGGASAQTTSDPEGRFHARRLAPGAYRVVLSHPASPPRTFELELPAGEELRFELAPPLPSLPVLPAIRRVALGGRIELPSGLAEAAPDLAGYDVVLAPLADTPPFSGATERRVGTESDGSFRCTDLVAVRYALQVLPPWARGGSWPVLAQGEVDATAGEPGALVLPLAVGALEGELEEADGRPLVGALVRLTAVDRVDSLGSPQLWPPMVTDETGRYRAELLPPGRYQLHIRAGSALLDLEVEVRAGALSRVPRETMDLSSPVPVPGG
jgi:hypothetical protein